MILTKEEQRTLEGERGEAKQKAMELLVALGKIYGADKLIPIVSCQISGVSYHNLGDAGLEFINNLAKDGRVEVLTTLNPAGMDLENWKKLGIDKDFAKKQMEVINAFGRMGVTISCTCTPYLIGNVPLFGQHLSWGESSAVCFANSVLGARTNKEGGPSSIAAALTGKTANYGLHLDEKRKPEITVKVPDLADSYEFSALGHACGKKIKDKIPLFTGIKSASLEQLKSLSAAIPTYTTVSIFHIRGITPEQFEEPEERMEIERKDILESIRELSDDGNEIDLVSVGCPHCSLNEIKELADMLKNRKVKTELWICVSRGVKSLSDRMGYTDTIEKSGAKMAIDTCMAVAPLKGRFKSMATNSSKACYYARGSNNFKTKFGSLQQCIESALTGRWK